MQRDSSVPPEPAAPEVAGAAADAGSQVSLDEGSSDAAVSDGLCALGVTTNTYQSGSPSRGILTLYNLDSATWTLPTIRFLLRSSAYVCNDVNILPGTGWTLRSSAGQCEYTKTPPALSIATGKTLLFEYSSSAPDDASENAVDYISVSGCP